VSAGSEEKGDLAERERQLLRGLVRVNNLDREALIAGLLRTCGCVRWAHDVADDGPFADLAELWSSAERHWQTATREELLEAFSHHPRIGDPTSAKAPHDAKAHGWASKEQAGAASASDNVKMQLAAGNRVYEERFGHVYLVCATGKTAEEMLALLNTRLTHDAAAELAIAQGEQQKITRIRLERWLSE
jgi:2-oxo-4-hydroxy-4-carboxy-5-ureidoimidazoline decarboxylase